MCFRDEKTLDRLRAHRVLVSFCLVRNKLNNEIRGIANAGTTRRTQLVEELPVFDAVRDVAQSNGPEWFATGTRVGEGSIAL
jgi:hypothetical protein